MISTRLFMRSLIVSIFLFAGSSVILKYRFDESYSEVQNEVKLLAHQANFEKQIRARADSIEKRSYPVESLVSN